MVPFALINFSSCSSSKVCASKAGKTLLPDAYTTKVFHKSDQKKLLEIEDQSIMTITDRSLIDEDSFSESEMLKEELNKKQKDLLKLSKLE